MQYEAIETIRLKTRTGPLELFPGQRILLEPERALRLVEVGKLKPVEPEPNIEDYCALCSQAIERIHNDYYPQAFGWMEWVKEHKPELWEQIEEAEQKLGSPIEQGITLEQFTDFLGRWETLVGRAIEQFLKE